MVNLAMEKHDNLLPAMLVDLVQAPIRWQIVKIAFSQRIFDHLATPITAQDVATRLGFDAVRCELYLNALCAMGLIEKQQGLFVNRAGYGAFLQSDGEKSMGDLILHLAKTRHDDLELLLKGGETSAPLDMNRAEHWDGAAKSLFAFHRSVAGEQMFACLCELPEWETARHFLDIGAGSSILAQKIVASHPARRATIIDLPPLAQRMTQEQLADFPARDRITVMAGDFNHVDLPENQDVIWASMTLYYARDLTAVLRRCRQSLAPGGVFVSFHEELCHERTLPEPHIVGRLIPAMKGNDASFDKDQIAQAMRAAGFASISVRMVQTVVGPMAVTMGR
ncbi:methyltransferase [Thalassospira sp. TSL5-1]|uniref:methyltransferase n=1 Tax=Thalassospira sp. TSL5-1 TaxID=1544451 RepID=UPI00093A4E3A|nr:methyltransferase [Thalassospira sp. TSL5-1]